nr:PREDICTED: SET and MYND domain-containing protein 5 [Latimeria chalumnae]|eukprot:XP_014345514.1 PREDICTED: SET and MYND domain-containing protein 5 [Latimeria chalumnae]
MAASRNDMFSFCVDPLKTRSAVEIRFINNVKGKGLFATRGIRKGEVVFIEKPLVSAQFLWNALYRYRETLPHPGQCCVRKELWESSPHPQVQYCSPECKRVAYERYHRVLCLGPSREDPEHPLNKLQEAWRAPKRRLCLPLAMTPWSGMSEAASSARIAMSLPVDSLAHFLPQAKDEGLWMNLFSQFCSRTANEEEEIIHKLLGEKFKGQLEILRKLFAEVLYDERLSRWFTPEGFRSLFALVGTNGQGIGTSSLSQWVHGCDALDLPTRKREQLDAFVDQLYKDIEKVTGEFLNCEGSGLYILQSCCNHSCIPNAEVSFPDNNFLLHLTTLIDIQPGEEICISYLDCCQRDRSRHSRHKILGENYLFVCSCPKCLAQADDPDVTSEEEEEVEAEGETDDAELEDEMTDV